jgi:chemotaxis protein methyltransferase CheR
VNAAPTPAELTAFRETIEQRLGLRFDDGRAEELRRLLQQRVAAAGVAGPERYLAGLSATGAPELRVLAERLTVNETFFFRSPDNLRALVQTVLPERIRARGAQRRLRILSVGCASGEEPYSLAIQLRESLPELQDWDVQLTGLDLDPAVLAQARAGRYGTWSLRATPEALRRRYFRVEGRHHLLSPEVKRRVIFEERNLAQDAPAFWGGQGCDVIFCRNVLMYFSPRQAAEAVQRLASALLPGGSLFLGHAETLRGLSQAFQLVQDGDTFFYRRREGVEGAEGAPWREPLPAPAPEVAWYDAIGRASERISRLGSEAAGRRTRTPPPLPRLQAPSAPGPLPAPPPQALSAILELLRQERFAEALERLSAVAAGDVEALGLRAVLVAHLGRLDEARAACATLLAQAPLHAHAHHVLALCAEQAGHPDQAAAHERTASACDPGFAIPRLHLGLAARRAGDLPTARAELAQALRLLGREDALCLLLFGGGFSRATLLQLCRAELRAAGGAG